MDLLSPLFFHTFLDHTISSHTILNILKSPILTVQEVFTFIQMHMELREESYTCTLS